MARGRGELTPKDIEIRKIISTNINKLLEQYNKKQTDIHNATGIPKSTLTGYIKGTSTPNQGNIQKISDFFGVKKSDIDPRFSSDLKKQNERKLDINSIYSQLTPPRQQKVYNFAKNELTEQNKSNIIQGNFGKAVDEDEKQEVSYVGLLSAGHGCPNYDKERPLGTITMRESQIPSHYDLAFMVDGDSMYPTFENGEIVFIKQTPHVINGQIGAVEINGEAFLKKMYVENRRLRLVSLNCDCDKNGNRLYPDFYADEYDDLYVIGRVIV